MLDIFFMEVLGVLVEAEWHHLMTILQMSQKVVDNLLNGVNLALMVVQVAGHKFQAEMVVQILVEAVEVAHIIIEQIKVETVEAE